MIPKSSYPSDQKILRVVSINVNGLRSAEKKGIFDWIATSDADVICMQESRITHEQWTDNMELKRQRDCCQLLFRPLVRHALAQSLEQYVHNC
jgi:hypothetical protein